MPSKSNTWDRNLGAHHFAYMRAWAEGLSIEDAARRYLGVEHGNEIPALHRTIVDELRALARRGGDSRWRLIGVDVGAIERRAAEAGQLAGSPAKAPPSLDDWALEQGYDDGWSEEELLAMYAEAFPPGTRKSSTDTRKRYRNGRLRRRQLDILADLERVAIIPAGPHDPIEAWFEPSLARRLRASGFSTLGTLRDALHLSGRWWKSVRGLGPVKAQRVDDSVRRLLRTSDSALAGAPPALPHLRFLESFANATGPNRAATRRADMATDIDALRAWTSHKPFAALTHEAYTRESERFLMWCAIERSRNLSAVSTSDCLAYLDFLEEIPLAWRNRRKRARQDLGWTPFRGAPSAASKLLVRKVLGLMFAWLAGEGSYLAHDPWPARTSRSPRSAATESIEMMTAARAIPLDWLQLAGQQAGTLSNARNRVGLALLGTLPLRASELHRATSRDVLIDADGPALHITGARGSVRRIALPVSVWSLLEQHFESRGLPSPAQCSPDTPLLSAVGASSTAVTYSAIYKSLGVFLRRELRGTARARDRRLSDRSAAGQSGSVPVQPDRQMFPILSIYKSLLQRSESG